MSIPVKTVPDAVRAADPLLVSPLMTEIDEDLLQSILRDPRPLPAPAPHRRRALVAAAALSLGLVGAGGAVAVQSLPDRFATVFPWAGERSDPVAIATIDGYFGAELTYWVTTQPDGTVCLDAVHSYPGEDSEPLSRTRPGSSFGECGRTEGFDAHRGSGVKGPGLVYITGRDPRAATAEVRFPDGRSTPLTVVDGWVLGWYEAVPEVAPRLEVLDELGAVIHAASLPRG